MLVHVAAAFFLIRTLRAYAVLRHKERFRGCVFLLLTVLPLCSAHVTTRETLIHPTTKIDNLFAFPSFSLVLPLLPLSRTLAFVQSSRSRARLTKLLAATRLARIFPRFAEWLSVSLCVSHLDESERERESEGEKDRDTRTHECILDVFTFCLSHSVTRELVVPRA